MIMRAGHPGSQNTPLMQCPKTHAFGVLRARRPRSQGIPELWSRYHAARSRAKHTPANAETLTLRIPAPRGPSPADHQWRHGLVG